MSLAELKSKLALKQTRVALRYKYYEGKYVINDLSPLTPTQYRTIHGKLGWCAKAVDTLADRLNFDEFDDDTFMLNQIYNLNNRDVLINSAVLSALISSCSFIYISGDDTDYPRLQVIDGYNATGLIDPITNLLIEGYAVLDRDKNTGAVIMDAYFTADETQIFEHGKLTQTFKNPASYALLVPIIYRPDAVRPFGHSRISRAAIQLTNEAERVLNRASISADFYSTPQKYVLGMDNDAEFNNRLATMSTFLRVDKDEDGNKPTVGQFSQQSMSPHIEHLKSIAGAFAGETGLTLDDLGFSTSNPSSADAIKSAHENLRLSTRSAQASFGVGLLNAGYLAACVRDEYSYERKAFYSTSPQWLPIFEPDVSQIGTLGDAILKINQSIPDYLGTDDVRRLIGI